MTTTNLDLQRWQQAIQGIEAAQKYLPPDELSAFKILVEFYNDGIFETNESYENIQKLKNSTTKNRLLKKVYLPNFVVLCENYFKIKPVNFQSPDSFDSPPLGNPSLFTPSFKPPITETVITEHQDQTLVPPQQITTPVLVPPKNQFAVIETIISDPQAEITGGTQQEQQPNINTKNPTQKPESTHKVKRFAPIVIGVITILFMGYLMFKDNEWFTNLFSNQKNIEKIEIAKKANDDEKTDQEILISNHQVDEESSVIDERVNITDFNEKNESLKPTNLNQGTIYVNCGLYSGELKNGIPDGRGIMNYRKSVRIAKHARDKFCAEAGDTFVGLWGNGDIESGELRDRDNNVKAVILAGKRPNPYNINNDGPCE